MARPDLDTPTRHHQTSLHHPEVTPVCSRGDARIDFVGGRDDYRELARISGERHGDTTRGAATAWWRYHGGHGTRDQRPDWAANVEGKALQTAIVLLFRFENE